MFKYEKLTTIQENAFCPNPFTRMIINAWGDVTMCCHIGTESLGNVVNNNLISMWNSPKANNIRQETREGKLARPCKMAPNCPFHLKEKIPFTFETKVNYPTYIEIDLPAKHCNVGGENPTSDNPACIMCIRNHNFPKKQPDLTKLICTKVKPLMPHLSKFSVLGVAEPFWKDAVFDIFKMVNFSEYKHEIEFETNHNVTCFGKKTQERFLDEVEKSNLQFSLDAASSETYIKIRRLDAYDLCIKNLKLWMKKKNSNHKVTIWNNINLLNVHEMTQMVQTAIDLGVEAVYMLPTHNQNNKVDLGELLINNKNLDIFRRHSVAAMDLAVKNDMFLRYVTPFHIVPNSNKLVQIAVN